MSDEYNPDTGYKDCYGVKIYDGDILSHTDASDLYDLTVVRSDNSYNVLAQSKGRFSSSCYPLEWYFRKEKKYNPDLRVIGNDTDKLGVMIRIAGAILAKEEESKKHER